MVYACLNTVTIRFYTLGTYHKHQGISETMAGGGFVCIRRGFPPNITSDIYEESVVDGFSGSMPMVHLM
jgi:hypothetical protein